MRSDKLRAPGQLREGGKHSRSRVSHASGFPVKAGWAQRESYTGGRKVGLGAVQ